MLLKGHSRGLRIRRSSLLRDNSLRIWKQASFRSNENMMSPFLLEDRIKATISFLDLSQLNIQVQRRQVDDKSQLTKHLFHLKKHAVESRAPVRNYLCQLLWQHGVHFSLKCLSFWGLDTIQKELYCFQSCWSLMKGYTVAEKRACR